MHSLPLCVPLPRPCVPAGHCFLGAHLLRRCVPDCRFSVVLAQCLSRGSTLLGNSTWQGPTILQYGRQYLAILSTIHHPCICIPIHHTPPLHYPCIPVHHTPPLLFQHACPIPAIQSILQQPTTQTHQWNTTPAPSPHHPCT
jgi:hypothetical protein